MCDDNLMKVSIFFLIAFYPIRISQIISFWLESFLGKQGKITPADHYSYCSTGLEAQINSIYARCKTTWRMCVYNTNVFTLINTSINTIYTYIYTYTCIHINTYIYVYISYISLIIYTHIYIPYKHVSLFSLYLHYVLSCFIKYILWQSLTIWSNISGVLISCPVQSQTRTQTCKQESLTSVQFCHSCPISSGRLTQLPQFRWPLKYCGDGVPHQGHKDNYCLHF